MMVVPAFVIRANSRKCCITVLAFFALLLITILFFAQVPKRIEGKVSDYTTQVFTLISKALHLL